MSSARGFRELLVVATLSVPATSVAEPLMVDGTLVHPGCIYELTTKANGDNIVLTVHLSRTRLRGCLESNRYHQDVEDQDSKPLFRDHGVLGRGWFYYSVVGRLDEQTLEWYRMLTGRRATWLTETPHVMTKWPLVTG